MSYLICEKCGGYYELKEGESPDDFDHCSCGGELKYIKSFDNSSEVPSDTPNTVICHACGKETWDTRLCQWCGILLKHNNHHETHNKDCKLGIHGILGNLIFFWNNQSRRNKILIGTAAFLLLLCLFFVLTMPQKYHVGNSTFRLPDSYRIVGGYTADEVSKTELYSDKTLITIEILQFSTLAGSDEYVYDLFINPETMETRNGQIVIFNKKPININSTDIMVFEDKTFPQKYYVFDKNGKYYLIRLSYGNQIYSNHADETMQMIVNTIK